RRPVRAIEIQALLGQIGGSDRRVAGGVVAMAVVAVAGGAIVKEHFAAGGLGGVGLLPADLQDVFGDVGDLGIGQVPLVAEFLGVVGVAKCRIVGEHVRLLAARIRVAGADAITHRPFDVGWKFDQSARRQVVAG